MTNFLSLIDYKESNKEIRMRINNEICCIYNERKEYITKYSVGFKTITVKYFQDSAL